MRQSGVHFNLSWLNRTPRRVMFILCSDDYLGAALIAPWDAAMVLQTPDGDADSRELLSRATLEYAVIQEKLRHIIVLAHQGCHTAVNDGQDKALEKALVRWQTLKNDTFSQSLFQAHRVELRLLWTDMMSGQVSEFRPDEKRPIGRDGFERTMVSLEEPTS